MLFPMRTAFANSHVPFVIDAEVFDHIGELLNPINGQMSKSIMPKANVIRTCGYLCLAWDADCVELVKVSSSSREGNDLPRCIFDFATRFIEND